MNIFDVESYLTLVMMFVLLAVTIFAFVNSLLYSAESYVAAGKLTKPAWNIILGLARAAAADPGRAAPASGSR